MIEFATNLLYSRMLDEKKEDSESISSPANNVRNGQGSPNRSNEDHWGLRGQKTTTADSINSIHRTKIRITSRIDMIAFIAFSFIFLIFNFIYYIACLL